MSQNQLPTVICSPYDGCSSFISAAVVKHPDSKQLREKGFVTLTIQVTGPS